MIDYSALKEYFEQRAIHHKEIGHQPDVEGKNAFLFGDVDVMLRDISGCNSNGYVLLFEYGDAQISGDNEDSLFESSPIALVVCKSVQDRNYAEESEVEKTSHDILMQILGRMKKHRNAGNTVLKHFDLTRFEYQKVSGFGNNHFGWRMQLTIQTATQIVDVPGEWTD